MAHASIRRLARFWASQSLFFLESTLIDQSNPKTRGPHWRARIASDMPLPGRSSYVAHCASRRVVTVLGISSQLGFSPRAPGQAGQLGRRGIWRKPRSRRPAGPGVEGSLGQRLRLNRVTWVAKCNDEKAGPVSVSPIGVSRLPFWVILINKSAFQKKTTKRGSAGQGSFLVVARVIRSQPEGAAHGAALPRCPPGSQPLGVCAPARR
jgi:hypothetical protein